VIRAFGIPHVAEELNRGSVAQRLSILMTLKEGATIENEAVKYVKIS
jgi:hypothetical protein